MKLLNWEVKLGISLIILSLVVYLLKFIILGDPNNTYYYVFNALGFLPLNVLLVTLVLNKLLILRSKRERLQKVNMVIGIFFSEVGTELLACFSKQDPLLDKIKKRLIIGENWSEIEFTSVSNELKTYNYQVEARTIALKAIHQRLSGKRDFLLRLLENPVLLEYESFSELLRAVFHLTEELDWRKDLNSLPDSDLQHIASDISRAYEHLVVQWLAYLQYLNENYPYLFSLALRTNPFDENSTPIVS
ncbi:MAG: hypothetical protein PHT62_07425 [Desulfotomaculaceae bacterium]|nr:hypothetical protein [Desulfotomaculaceae bacterium]